MPKYIDADALRKRLEQIAEESKPAATARPMREDTPSELLRYGMARAIIEYLDEIPTADVEPKRKTGHWVYKHRTQVHYHKETGEDVINGEKRTVMVYTDLSGKYPHCPYCDALAADSFMNYCPRCGAELIPEPPKEENNA